MASRYVDAHHFAFRVLPGELSSLRALDGLDLHRSRLLLATEGFPNRWYQAHDRGPPLLTSVG